MPIACTLTSAELRSRRARVAALARRSLRSRDGDRLVFDPAAEPALRELVALEAECCPFLTLDLQRGGDALTLAITGPPEAAPIIDEWRTWVARSELDAATPGRFSEPRDSS